jgi:hypothetical protein
MNANPPSTPIIMSFRHDCSKWKVMLENFLISSHKLILEGGTEDGGVQVILG